jgi:hypothetical protein
MPPLAEDVAFLPWFALLAEVPHVP